MSIKILVIEDEPPIAEMIKFGLQRASYEVILAGNGEEALNLIKQHSPDLIISDILMPVMDGFTFYKELKKNPLMAKIPVLILTARGKMEDSFKVIGVDDFIVKPFDVDVLLGKIQNSLKKIPPKAPTPKTVLIAGTVAAVVQNIAQQLKQKECIVFATLDASEVVEKAMRHKPNLILIELTINQTPAQEIIRALRCISQCHLTFILTYSYLTSKDIGNEFTYWKLSSINEARLSCQDAGANEYIGHYSEPVFGEMIEKYLNKINN